MTAFNSGPSIKLYRKISNWFNFDKNNVLQVYSGKIDIGQHISSTLALISSKITGINYDQVEIIKLNTDISPNEGKTASSLSVPDSGSAIKAASFTLRKSFLKYSLQTLKVDIDEIIFDNGIIKDINSNRSVSYWDFANTKEFNELIIPEEFDENEIKEFNYKNNQKIETKTIHDIVSGKYSYVHDLKFPKMLHARIIRPPNYYSKFVKIINEIEDKLIELDIKLIVKGSFLAILSLDEFLVVKYLEIIKQNIVWEELRDLSNNNIYKSLKENDRDTLLVKSGGQAFYEAIPIIKDFKDKSCTTLTSEYKKGYLMHGPIGPSAACSIFSNNKFTIYSHSQALYDLKLSCSEYFGVNPENVTLKFIPGSGCYGHNGADDVAFEAGLLSKEFPDTHVLLKWTRQDEHCWEPYGSASLNKLTGVINDKGKIIYWSNEVFSDTYMTRPSNTELDNFISYNLVNNHFIKRKSTPKTNAHMGIHRNLDPLYDFGETRLIKNLVHDLPLRTSALRTLGAFSNVVALECFINEIAKTKNIDPFEIRINHLSDERAIGVIKNLRDQMTKEIQKEGLHRGIGFSRYKNSAAFCAVGVELKVNDDLEIKLINAWISVDAGEVAYEDGIKAQVEGGFIQAASWSLYEEVKFDTKEIISIDWDTYQIIGFDNIPNIKTDVLDKEGLPYLGVGEVVAGPTGAAISNAISDALGQTIKTMPFTKEIITKELLET
jgi:CO/xanthine dehydrogenase Mo-binding subunit